MKTYDPDNLDHYLFYPTYRSLPEYLPFLSERRRIRWRNIILFDIYLRTKKESSI